MICSKVVQTVHFASGPLQRLSLRGELRMSRKAGFVNISKGRLFAEPVRGVRMSP